MTHWRRPLFVHFSPHKFTVHSTSEKEDKRRRSPIICIPLSTHTVIQMFSINSSLQYPVPRWRRRSADFWAFLHSNRKTAIISCGTSSSSPSSNDDSVSIQKQSHVIPLWPILQYVQKTVPNTCLMEMWGQWVFTTLYLNLIMIFKLCCYETIFIQGLFVSRVLKSWELRAMASYQRT